VIRRVPAGTTFIEVLAALLIFAVGIVPILFLLSDSRRVATAGANELQATGLASSLVGRLRALPASALRSFPGGEFADEALPASYALTRLDVPPAPPHLRRLTTVRMVNAPDLPRERLSNPWGEVVEIGVRVLLRPEAGGTPPDGKPLLRLKSYRNLEDTR